MRPDASDRLKAAAPKQGPNKGLIAAVVVLVVALVAGGAYFMTNKKTTTTDAGGRKVWGQSVSTTTPGGKGITVFADKKSAGPSVDVWEDFQCPYCKHFEAAQGEKLEKLAAAGKITLTYHIVSFLDRPLNNTASSDAANAAFCAADQKYFVDFHNTIYANQPEKEGAGYTQQQLLDWGKKVGMDGDTYSTFESCVKSNKYKTDVTATTATMQSAGVTGTPSVLVDGKKLDENTMSDLIGGGDIEKQILKK